MGDQGVQLALVAFENLSDLGNTAVHKTGQLLPGDPKRQLQQPQARCRAVVLEPQPWVAHAADNVLAELIQVYPLQQRRFYLG